jgi:glycosyltransferase involved in cell wall biosynthesis
MKKVLILILAYNAERHIAKVIDRIPAELWNNSEYKAEVVIIDDCSKDATSAVAREHINKSPYPIKLLRNARNQGYGGNQKVGYTYAIDNGYDAVVMVHGDGQYPPEKIPDMFAPIIRGEADAVFGSRMLNKKDAIAGGMPYYKFVGNITLTQVQNAMLGSRLSEFHSGFRAYSVAALKRIPFQYNSDVFHFDTDIIIQLIDSKMVIKEIPIPTHYGDEVCHVNGMRYAKDVMIATMLSRIQKYGIFYAPKFDYQLAAEYKDKSAFASSHQFAVSQVGPGEKVLDINYGLEAHVAARLKQMGCKVEGFAMHDTGRAHYDMFSLCDFNTPDFSKLNAANYNVILLLDVLERLLSPEQFLKALYDWCHEAKPRLIVTVPNIAFFIQRFMLLIGQFNYGRRGTLDMTHTRLFTFGSITRVLTNARFNITMTEAIPAPFPIAVGDNWLGRGLLKINLFLMKISKSLFSYQIAVIAEPRPTLESLVQQAIETGDKVK